MGKYQDLIVFQKADELAFQIYKITDSFSKGEIFGITSQIRKSVIIIKSIAKLIVTYVIST
jgi:four helix bundle protein